MTYDRPPKLCLVQAVWQSSSAETRDSSKPKRGDPKPEQLGAKQAMSPNATATTREGPRGGKFGQPWTKCQKIQNCESEKDRVGKGVIEGQTCSRVGRVSYAQVEYHFV